MAVYELTIRFEAGDDAEALFFAVEQEKIFRGEFTPPVLWPRRECAIGQLARVIVTQVDDGDQPC